MAAAAAELARQAAAAEAERAKLIAEIERRKRDSGLFRREGAAVNVFFDRAAQQQAVRACACALS